MIFSSPKAATAELAVDQIYNCAYHYPEQTLRHLNRYHCLILQQSTENPKQWKRIIHQKIIIPCSEISSTIGAERNRDLIRSSWTPSNLSPPNPRDLYDRSLFHGYWYQPVEMGLSACYSRSIQLTDRIATRLWLVLRKMFSYFLTWLQITRPCSGSKRSSYLAADNKTLLRQQAVILLGCG